MLRIEEFKLDKYGLFIHFGVYSYLQGYYKGKKSSNYAEWIQSYFKIPNREYEKIASKFNPKSFNADKLVKNAKELGFNYLVFTCKHHDGFCMYDSKVDDFNIVKVSKYSKDIFKELQSACDKYKMKLGFYYSQDLDWHNLNGGGYLTNNIDCAGKSWSNNWDYKDIKKDFNKYFYSKALPQIKELLTNYGKISIAWFDIPFTLTKSQSEEIYNLVKKYQPDCLINSRLGNGKYDYVTFGDNEIPNSKEELTRINSKDNEINGIKESKNNLYEVCLSLTNSWGYSRHSKYKSLKKLNAYKDKANKLGINLLINVGPNRKGKISFKSKYLLKKLLKEKEKN